MQDPYDINSYAWKIFPMVYGNKPVDGGNLILSPEEREEIIKKNPLSEKYIRQYMSAEDFIHNKKRFCLWLVDCPPDELRKMPLVYERVKKVREFRLNSKKAQTRKFADIPTLFTEIRQPKKNYILVPSVSGERRKYIPMDFVSPEIICSNLNFMIPDADVYDFGILQSSVHMIFTKTVCGRLGSSLRYSAQIVYNNFPFMVPNFVQWETIRLAAFEILDARKNYPNASLADLYDPIAMPRDLRKAHEKNDKAVMELYGYDEKISETEIATDLLLRNNFVVKYLQEHGLE